ncbi:MAG: outer membrane protein [Nitrospirales bacterium]
MIATPSQAAADTSFYLAGYGGYAFPEDWQDVTGRGPLTGQRFPDRDLDNAPLVGVKGGLNIVSWFGLEAEVFYTSPRAVAQPASFGTASANLEVTTVALNYVLRYPGTIVQPYIGKGVAFIFANSFQAGGSAQNTGINLLAGIRFVLGKHLWAFSEYKHSRVTLEFSNVEVDYRLHSVIGGVGWTF